MLTRHALLSLAVPTFLFLAAAAAPSFAQKYDGTFERTLPAGGVVELAVRAGAGGIRVDAGDAATIRIVGRLRADAWGSTDDVMDRIRQIEKAPPIAQDGSRVSVGFDPGDSLLRHITVSYEISIPAACRLRATTGSGAITVSGIDGGVESRSGSGHATVRKARGAVQVTTGSGGIDVDGAASLQSSSGSGAIRATAVGGAASAKTGSGSIRIEFAGKGDADVSSSSGHVEITGLDGAARVSTSSSALEVSGRPAGNWTISTSSGSVRLSLPGDAAFNLDARSSSGNIESAHPVTFSGRADKHRLEGAVRGGGPVVSVHTSSGAITVR
jgi:hypothetical protein